MKIGVFTPTYNRPDYARSLVLQMANQRLRPDVVVIHQNGTAEDYRWAVEDIETGFEVRWIHTGRMIPQDDWYRIPLLHLIAEGCTHYFWCDHDDIYLADHVEAGVARLEAGADFSVNSHSGVLKLQKPAFSFRNSVRFSSHAPGGMSSSMCFNRAFAEALAADLAANQGRHAFSDQVVAFTTAPRFERLLADTQCRPTTIYVAHSHSLTSSSWLSAEPPTLGALLTPLVQDAGEPAQPNLTLTAHIGQIGDVTNGNGLSILAGPGAEFGIQGIEIRSEADILEYKVRTPTAGWSDWVSCNRFAGSRGRRENLTGVLARTKGVARERFRVELIAAFAGQRGYRRVREDQADGLDHVNAPMVGLQFTLLRR